MDTLWDSVAVSDGSGNGDLSGTWSRPGNIRGFWQQTVIQILRKKETVVLVASVSGIGACCVMYGRFSKPIL